LPLGCISPNGFLVKGVLISGELSRGFFLGEVEQFFELGLDEDTDEEVDEFSDLLDAVGVVDLPVLDPRMAVLRYLFLFFLFFFSAVLSRDSLGLDLE